MMIQLHLKLSLTKCHNVFTMFAIITYTMYISHMLNRWTLNQCDEITNGNFNQKTIELIGTLIALLHWKGEINWNDHTSDKMPLLLVCITINHLIRPRIDGIKRSHCAIMSNVYPFIQIKSFSMTFNWWYQDNCIDDGQEWRKKNQTKFQSCNNRIRTENHVDL